MDKEEQPPSAPAEGPSPWLSDQAKATPEVAPEEVLDALLAQLRAGLLKAPPEAWGEAIIGWATQYALDTGGTVAQVHKTVDQVDDAQEEIAKAREVALAKISAEALKSPAADKVVAALPPPREDG